MPGADAARWLGDALDRVGHFTDSHPTLRARENEVLFKPLLIAALVRINGISRDTAEAIFNDLAGLSDNQEWLEVLRGHYSRKVPGEETHRTIRVIDFDHPALNDFACTSQLRVQGQVVRKPDVVVYVNGIPLVVIEAKSPLSPSQNAFDAIDQVRSAEREVPRLFHSNLFNIATNDLTFMYGATGAPREHWARWRDPWPRKAEEFNDETEKGLYSLLEPSRLLDILAHLEARLAAAGAAGHLRPGRADPDRPDARAHRHHAEPGRAGAGGAGAGPGPAGHP